MIPKYRLVYEAILQDINSPTRASLKLPTERALCAQHDVSRQTVREALSILEKDGIITKHQGDGIYIRKSYFSARNRIALLIDTAEEYIYPEMISSLKDKLLQEGFSLKIYETENSPVKEAEILGRILNSHIRGIISIPIMNSMPCAATILYQKLSSKGINVVFWRGVYPNLTNFPSVGPDDQTLSFRLTNEILSTKTKPHGIFFKDSLPGRNRYLGFMQALIDREVPIEDQDILLIDYSDLIAMRKGNRVESIDSFLNRQDIKKIVCHNDEVAYYVSKLIPQTGDTDIFSFDGSYLSRHIEKRIKSVNISFGEEIDELLASVIPR